MTVTMYDQVAVCPGQGAVRLAATGLNRYPHQGGEAVVQIYLPSIQETTKEIS